MRSWAIKRAAAALALLLACTLCGCERLLERSDVSFEPHSAVYRESDDGGTLRADSYQDLVNALLLLLGDHAESGVVRLYSDEDVSGYCDRACREVQQETALGAYLLDYITYSQKQERGFLELSLSFGYRRTAEQQAAVLNATTTEAIPDLLREAAAREEDRLCVRVSYFTTDAAGVEAMVTAVQGEQPEGAWQQPWRAAFYPSADEPELVELCLVYEPGEFPEVEPEEPPEETTVPPEDAPLPAPEETEEPQRHEP